MREVALCVGVDARPLNEPPCGIRRYLESLLKALLNLDNATDYVLLSNKPLSQYPGDRNPRVRVKVIAGSHQALMRPWWETVRLPKTIKKTPIDLFFSPVGIVPGRCTVPTVVTIHDLAFLKFPKIQPWNYLAYWKWVTRRACLADALIAVSHSTKADITQLLAVEPKRVHVVWEGLESSFGKPVTEADIESIRVKYGLRKPFVLFVGAREPRKNLTTLLKAMSSLNEKRTDTIPLVLVGSEGWGKQQDPREFGHWVRILKTVSDEELKALYSAATVFAFPSLYEGFGLPLLEAMACETAIIASNVSSLPELTGDAAILVNPTDVAEWAQALETVLQDSNLREKLIEKGRTQVQQFTWSQAARETHDLFVRTLLESRLPENLQH